MRKVATNRLRHAWFSCCHLGFFVLGAATAGGQTNPGNNAVVPLTEVERAWVQKHPVVYWGADPKWPPFSYFDKQGRMAGIDVEVVKLLGQRTGLNLQLVESSSWPETMRMAISNQIDFVGGIARTEERERLHGLRFTEVFCNFPTVIVTRKETPFLTSLNDVRMKRIALPKDYATTEELEKRYPSAHFVITDNEEQSMLAVAGDDADCTVLNLASASYVEHMRGLTNLKISGFSDLDFFLCMAVRKEEPELRSILEKGLATIDPKDKEEIYERYIPTETRSEINWRTWRRRVIYAVLAGMVGLTAVLCWNRSLTKEIRRRTATETALLEAHEKLEKRAGEMELLNAKLSNANRDLESFSYSVSHDLKSPLRRLRSFAELLEEDIGPRIDGDARQYLSVIQHEIRRMGELIEALLTFARIGRTQVHPTPVKLDEVVREVVKDVEVETKGREIRWEIHPLPETRCDRGLIKQVAANLVDNAVKFTRGREPARIEIGALAGKAEDKETVFYVKDNGAGFEMNDASTLFEAFHRLHRQEEFEGSGIGLASVKRIIQKHGGRVWAEGEPDKGATFYFSLARGNGQPGGNGNS